MSPTWSRRTIQRVPESRPTPGSLELPRFAMRFGTRLRGRDLRQAKVPLRVIQFSPGIWSILRACGWGLLFGSLTQAANLADGPLFSNWISLIISSASAWILAIYWVCLRANDWIESLARGTLFTGTAISSYAAYEILFSEGRASRSMDPIIWDLMWYGPPGLAIVLVSGIARALLKRREPVVAAAALIVPTIALWQSALFWPGFLQILHYEQAHLVTVDTCTLVLICSFVHELKVRLKISSLTSRAPSPGERGE